MKKIKSYFVWATNIGWMKKPGQRYKQFITIDGLFTGIIIAPFTLPYFVLNRIGNIKISD